MLASFIISDKRSGGYSMQDSNSKKVSVHTRQLNFSLQELQNYVDANDIITDPDYQRRYVYDAKRASKLIESILIGIPIPVVYLAEEDEGIYSVIDGQQRITSFVKYLKNEFALSGLTKLSDLNGLLYKELDKGIQRRLKIQTISAVCIEKGSEDLKYEIFSRLNLGAVKLKDQEVRNCIYRGSFNNMLKDIAKTNQNLQILFHDDNKRFAYEERILRFFTLRNYMQLKGTYKLMMNEYMKKHSNDTDEQIRAAKNQYNSLIELIKAVMGDDAFFSFSNDHRRKFNGAIYDSIIIPFSYFQKRTIMKHSDEIRNEINQLKRENADYQNWVYVGTNAGSKIRNRIDAVMHIINRVTVSDSQNWGKRLFDSSVKEQLFHCGYICSYCGNQILSIDDCEVDHIIPYDCGGPTEIENAQLLHKWCNRSKRNKPASIEDFVDDSDDDES